MISKDEIREAIREVLFAYGRKLGRSVLLNKTVMYIVENYKSGYEFQTVSDLLDEELFIY